MSKKLSVKYTLEPQCIVVQVSVSATGGLLKITPSIRAEWLKAIELDLLKKYAIIKN